MSEHLIRIDSDGKLGDAWHVPHPSGYEVELSDRMLKVAQVIKEKAAS